ncbi:MAG: NTP transferase domain-containing protein [Cytophagales bacterium]|nr:NTP transferase domain-containing protein [Cytophagales bacterium]
MRGYILAGGKSSRMGTDKGMLAYGQHTMAAHIAATLSKCDIEVYIVSNHYDQNSIQYPIIKDIIPNLGPAGGIYSALIHTDSAHNVILSCDTPFITMDSLLYITNKYIPTYDTCVATENNKIHPLFGIYHKNCAEYFELCLKNNELKLQNIIKSLNCQYIDMSMYAHSANNIFLNINTPDDYQKIMTSQEQKIKILAFGMLADIAKASNWDMPLVKDTNSLIAHLYDTYPDMCNVIFSISVNKKIAVQNTLIHTGDEIALLPPFSGG